MPPAPIIAPHQADGTQTASFGALRLFFAALVVLAHSAVFVGPQSAHDQFLAIFNTARSGEIAVNEFFVISGFLIAGSWANSRSVVQFLLKRTLRIYPAFLLNYAVCVLVVAPLAGLPFSDWEVPPGEAVRQALLLAMPQVGPVFTGSPDPALNGAAWTIQWEFACYLLMAVLGTAGLLRAQRTLLAAAWLLLALTVVTGSMIPGIRFPAMFLTGVCFYASRHRIAWHPAAVLVAAGLFAITFIDGRFLPVATALGGGYLVLCVAKSASRTWLGRVNEKTDISYGLYLYSWPVAKLLVWFIPGLSIAALDAATLLCAGALGWLSWIVVERPAIAAGRRLGSAARNARPAAAEASIPA